MELVIARSPESERPRRLNSLDGLRGLAILGVLICHLCPIPGGATCGWLGVNLFFVLSGFLITRILLEQRDTLGTGGGIRRALGIFYGRRALRIFPLYFATLAVIWTCNVADSRTAALWLATYTYNVCAAAGHHWAVSFAHFWSLCVEEQFYMLWPVVILLCPRRALPWVMGAMFMAGPAWRVGCLCLGTTRLPPALATFGSLDPLTAGAFLAWCERRGEESRARFLAVARVGGAGLMLVWLAVWLRARPIMWGTVSIDVLVGNSAMALFFAFAVGRATRPLGGDYGAFLQMRWLRYLGTISYGVYVIHLFVPLMWAKLGPQVPILAIAPVYAHLALSVLLGAASWHLFEKPIQSLKRLLPYAAAKPPALPMARAA